MRLVAYDDGTGVWTVGYGSTTDIAPGEKITIAEAEERLANDVAEAENCVNGAVHVPLTQPEFDSLVSFVFNVGCGKFRKSTLLKKLNDYCDYEGAAQELKRWTKAGGIELEGLKRRRYAEIKLFESSESA